VAAVRRDLVTDCARRGQHGAALGEDGRPHGRDLHQRAVQPLPLSGHPHPLCQSDRLGEGGAQLVEFANAPAGTGPFRIVKVTPRVSVEMARSQDYWDETRRAKLDRMIVMPMPEPNTRVSALRAGQLDWIEVRHPT